MLKMLGILLLLGGSIGMGWSLRESLKNNLEELYRLREIFSILQNEIIYSRASLPEACRRIGGVVKEPYRAAFLGIYEEMSANRGESFAAAWKKHMEECLEQVRISGEDKKVFLDFGNCIGYPDGRMQAEAVGSYMHKLDLSVDRLEKDIMGRCKIIMSLSVMGGFMAAIILI